MLTLKQASLPLPQMDKAKEYIEQSKAPNTTKAYANDWNHFTGFCESLGAEALPVAPAVMLSYLSKLADTCKVSTIERRIASINQAHHLAGFERPSKNAMVQNVLKGIKRTLGVKQKQAKPTLATDILAMVETLPSNTLGIRDKALLMLGFAGAFRRSELVSLLVDDLSFTAKGLEVLVRKSKTDQEGEGHTKPIPCPATINAVKEWIATAGITEGNLFRSIDRHGNIGKSMSDKAVAIVVKRTAEQAGLDPKDYSGHSLRAGYVTEGVNKGIPTHTIKKVTGHKSDKQLEKYIREANLFRSVPSLF